LPAHYPEPAGGSRAGRCRTSTKTWAGSRQTGSRRTTRSCWGAGPAGCSRRPGRRSLTPATRGPPGWTPGR